jgi:transcriptional regulator with XRE-family HTH domain
VRSLRLEKGMSQEKLGNQLALTFQQIQKYENGTNRIGAARLQRIAQILGVSVSALYPDPVPAGRNSQEVTELIDTGSTLRLLRAYSRMRSPSLQRALTTLVEEIAEKS